MAGSWQAARSRKSSRRKSGTLTTLTLRLKCLFRWSHCDRSAGGRDGYNCNPPLPITAYRFDACAHCMPAWESHGHLADSPTPRAAGRDARSRLWPPHYVVTTSSKLVTGCWRSLRPSRRGLRWTCCSGCRCRGRLASSFLKTMFDGVGRNASHPQQQPSAGA